MSVDGRRLAAIMFTDVVGYSRLMAEDEQRALALLHRMRALLGPMIASAGGTLHKEIGDGTLSSFASAVDATRCALQIQRTLREQPDFELRIGLHVGDVVLDGNDVHGDGVNIAARIEPLAPPGGLALSDAVLIQLRGRLELQLRSLGHPMLKNIGLAIEVFVHLPEETAAEPAPETEASWLRRAWRRLRSGRVFQWVAAYTALAFAVLQGVVLLADLFQFSGLVGRIAAVLLIWGVPVAAIVAWFHGTAGIQRLARREIALLLAVSAASAVTIGWQVLHWQAPQAIVPPQSVAPQTAPGSVAVLSFESQGGRAEDAYLSEGFSDELRDQLSRVAGLRVVARESSVAFREHKTPAQTVAAELGVATVIEGSLRREGEQIRIAVRLIDGASGVQRWSEAYDRSTTSLLAVQQEVALAAAKAILPQLSPADMPKPQWQAPVHDLMLLARTYQQSAVRPEDQDRVIELYRQVLEQDPESAAAHARLGRALMFRGKDPAAAEHELREALDIDPKLAEGYANLGLMLYSQFRKGSGEMFQRAFELNPNDPEVLHYYSQYVGLQRANLDASGTRDSYMLRARELDPMSLWINADVGWAYATSGRIAQLKPVLAQIERRFPDAAGRQALGRLADTGGMLDEAIAWGLESLRLDPGNRATRLDLAERYARLGMDQEPLVVESRDSLRVLFWQRRYQEMVDRMATVDLDEADMDEIGRLAFALQALGRDAEAVPLLQGMGLPEIALDNELRRYAALHNLTTMIGSLKATGDDLQARRLAQWLYNFSTRGHTARENGWGAWFWTSCTLAALDRREEALDAFERGADAPNLAWLPLFRDSACFRSLHGEPRYQAALSRLEARHRALREQLPATLARHAQEGKSEGDARSSSP